MLQFRLPKGSVITGTVYDHYGAPLANVRVGLRQWITRDGERMLTTAGGVGGTTDDRGAYRIYGLQPGSYLVVMTPPNPGTERRDAHAVGRRDAAGDHGSAGAADDGAQRKSAGVADSGLGTRADADRDHSPAASGTVAASAGDGPRRRLLAKSTTRAHRSTPRPSPSPSRRDRNCRAST